MRCGASCPTIMYVAHIIQIILRAPIILLIDNMLVSTASLLFHCLLACRNALRKYEVYGSNGIASSCVKLDQGTGLRNHPDMPGFLRSKTVYWIILCDMETKSLINKIVFRCYCFQGKFSHAQDVLRSYQACRWHGRLCQVLI